MRKFKVKILVEQERYYDMEAESLEELEKDLFEGVEMLEPVETNIINEGLEWIRTISDKEY